jgi:DNA-binding NarL/FixJ family response regulator
MNEYRLTQRHHRVLECLLLGFSDREAGAALNLSPNTVRNTTAEILEFAEIHSRARLLAMFIDRRHLEAKIRKFLSGDLTIETATKN